jgi:uncharacterized phiE125 gp8 family phage protein
MGSLNLLSGSPIAAFIEPLTVAEVEQFLRLPALSPTDDDRDSLMESLIIAAREVAEIEQRRDLVEKQWELSLDWWPGKIELREPLVSVDLVQYTDSDGTVTALIANTDYIVDTAKHPGVILPAYSKTWPTFTGWPSSPILVRFTSGLTSTDIFWSDAGQRVLLGMKMLIAHWYNNGDIMAMPGSTGAEIPWAAKVLLGTGAVPAGR